MDRSSNAGRGGGGGGEGGVVAVECKPYDDTLLPENVGTHAVKINLPVFHCVIRGPRAAL